MKDIQRAAELASEVLPGPLGEAVAVVLGDHEQDEHPDPNIHELAYRIAGTHRIFEAVALACPNEGDRLFIALAANLMTHPDVATNVDAAMRIAEQAIRTLVALAPSIHPNGDVSREPVNLVGHMLLLAKRNRQLSEELAELRGGAA